MSTNVFATHTLDIFVPGIETTVTTSHPSAEAVNEAILRYEAAGGKLEFCTYTLAMREGHEEGEWIGTIASTPQRNEDLGIITYLPLSMEFAEEG